MTYLGVNLFRSASIHLDVFVDPTFQLELKERTSIMNLMNHGNVRNLFMKV